MYILMFIAAIRLRYVKPQVPRPYRVPYQFRGMWVLSLMGIIGSIFAIILAFVPPTQLHVGNIFFYEVIPDCGIAYSGRDSSDYPSSKKASLDPHESIRRLRASSSR